MRKLSKIDESAWGDMRKRSSGDTIRKEDDVNLLDRDGLYDYLTSHYKNTNSFEPIYNSETFNTISVPFLFPYYVYLSFEENEVSIPYASPYVVKGFFSKLADEFSLKGDPKTGYIISPKDGSEVTNTFFIYVIDFLIDNIPDSFEKGVKKIIEESAWGDMRKRSSGETVRKEDYVPGNFSEIKYIDTGDENILWSDRNFVVGDQETFERDEIDFPKGYRYPTEKEVETLTGSWSGCIQKNEDGNIHIKDIVLPQGHYFVVEEGRRIEISKSLAGTSIIFCCAGDIEPKSNRHYKIRLVKEKKVNESAWGEMRQRSSGEIARKEDVIIDNETLKNKIKELYKEQGEGDTLDVSSLNKLKCDNLSNLFNNFDEVKQIIGLDTWDVSNVTNMRGMFAYCKSLTELNIDNWDVSNVTDMFYMFNKCISLTKLNISNWDVSNVTDMSYMFDGCRNLKKLNISNWNVSNVTDMGYMFDDCNKLIKPKWFK